MDTVYAKRQWQIKSGVQRHGRSLETSNLDGMELARLREHRRSLPIREILLFVLAVVSFKIFLFLDLGGATYGAKMEMLAQGNFAERVASYAMTLDPVSKYVIGGVTYGIW